jgi:hypothetical protein
MEDLMVMPLMLGTVLLDPPTAMFAGCVLALVSAKLIALRPEQELLRTGALGAGWGAFYAGCVGWLFFTEPDWMLVYLKDAREVALVPAFIVFAGLCAAHGALGALACGALLGRGKKGLAWAVTAAAAATLVSVFWLQWHQYFLVGTWEQYAAGRATRLQDDASTQMAMNVASAIAGVGSIALLVARVRQSRRAGTPPVARRVDSAS